MSPQRNPLRRRQSVDCFSNLLKSQRVKEGLGVVTFRIKLSSPRLRGQFLRRINQCCLPIPTCGLPICRDYSSCVGYLLALDKRYQLEAKVLSGAIVQATMCGAFVLFTSHYFDLAICRLAIGARYHEWPHAVFKWRLALVAEPLRGVRALPPMSLQFMTSR